MPSAGRSVVPGGTDLFNPICDALIDFDIIYLIIGLDRHIQPLAVFRGCLVRVCLLDARL